MARRSADGRSLAEAVAAFAVTADADRRTVDFDAVGRAQDIALADVLLQLPAEMDVERIGIAATASTVAVVSLDGRVRGPGRLWADHRASPQADAMRRAGHPNLVRMLGHVSPEWGIVKLAAMALDGELDRPGAELVVELADWLAHRMTGGWAANAGTREWGWAAGDDGHLPPELLQAAGVSAAYADRVVPDVRRTGSVLAAVSGATVRQLPRIDGAVVLVGGMDSYLAALGMGAGLPGRLCVSVGSSSALLAGLACGDAHGRMFGPLRTILPGDADGYWHGGQTTAGLAAEWARRILGARRVTLEREAATSRPGAAGVTFRETLLDRRTPSPRVRTSGAWTGLKLHHERGDLYRAVLEGIAFGLAEACGSLAPTEVVASGGMLRSAPFRQILADALERPVGRLREVSSAAALGAAFADVPEQIGSIARIVATTVPSGADYEAARARHRAAGADLPTDLEP